MSDAMTRAIRARMGRTGENYTTARTRMLQSATIPGASGPLLGDQDEPWGGRTLDELVALNWDGDGAFRGENGRSEPDDVRHDNTRRAGWALIALKAYAAEVGGDKESIVSDFLSDLRHLCDALGLEFYAESERGWRYYDEEARGRA